MGISTTTTTTTSWDFRQPPPSSPPDDGPPQESLAEYSTPSPSPGRAPNAANDGLASLSLREPIDWHRHRGERISIYFLPTRKGEVELRLMPWQIGTDVPSERLVALPRSYATGQLPAVYRLLSERAIKRVQNDQIYLSLNPYLVDSVEELADWLACLPPGSDKQRKLIALAKGVLEIFADKTPTEGDVAAIAKLAAARCEREEMPLLNHVLDALDLKSIYTNTSDVRKLVDSKTLTGQQKCRLIRGQALAIRSAARVSQPKLLGLLNDTSSSIGGIADQVQAAPDSALWNRLNGYLELYAAILDRITASPSFWIRGAKKEELIETANMLRLEAGLGEKLSHAWQRLNHTRLIHFNDARLYRARLVRELLTRLPDDSNPARGTLERAQTALSATKAGWSLVRSAFTLDLDAVCEKGKELVGLLKKDEDAQPWKELIDILEGLTDRALDGEDTFKAFSKVLHQVAQDYEYEIIRVGHKEPYANFFYRAVYLLEQRFLHLGESDSLDLLLQIFRDLTRPRKPGQATYFGNHGSVRRAAQHVSQRLLFCGDLTLRQRVQIEAVCKAADPRMNKIEAQLKGWLAGSTTGPLADLQDWASSAQPDLPSPNTGGLFARAFGDALDGARAILREIEINAPRGGKAKTDDLLEDNQFRFYWVVDRIRRTVLAQSSTLNVRLQAVALLNCLYREPTRFGGQTEASHLLTLTVQQLWSATTGPVHEFLTSVIRSQDRDLIEWMVAIRSGSLASSDEVSRCIRMVGSAPIDYRYGYWSALHQLQPQLETNRSEAHHLVELLVEKGSAWGVADPFYRWLTQAMARRPQAEATLITEGRKLVFPLIQEALDRWEEVKSGDLRHYIPGRAANAPGGEGSDLVGQVEEFLLSPSKILLLQGDSGSGKTSAALYLENQLINRCSRFIPHYVRLAHIRGGDLGSYLEKKCRDRALPYLFILDGVDELGVHSNLYQQHGLSDYPNAKFIFTCRSQHLQRGYRENFQTKSRLDKPDSRSLRELYLLPFTEEEQHAFIRSTMSLSASDVISRLNRFPELRELTHQPFALSILVEVLPKLTATSYRSDVYELFVQQRCELEQLRLNEGGDLAQAFYEFSKDLAFEMFVHGDQSVKLTGSSRYMRSTSRSVYDRLLRGTEDDLPLVRAGCMIRGVNIGSSKRQGDEYEFLHPSLRDYFASTKLFESIAHPAIFGARSIRDEQQIVEFLVYKLWSVPNQSAVQDMLFDLIKPADHSPVTAVASSNAAMLLVAAGIGLSGRNLRGACFDNADLTGGLFQGTDFRGASLRNTCLRGAQFVSADLSGADLTGATFGELGTLKMSSPVKCIAHHPQQPECAVGLEDGVVERWDMTLLKVIDRRICHTGCVSAIAYNLRGDLIASGSEDRRVHVWHLKQDGQSCSTFRGHEGWVKAIAVSPIQSMIASGGDDHSVRLWDPAISRVSTAILRGHSGPVQALTFRMDGAQLASASDDMSIRLWCTAELVTQSVINGHLAPVRSIAYTLDGKHLLSGSQDRSVRVWNIESSKNSTTIMTSDDSEVRCVACSADSRYLAAAGTSNTVFVWLATEPHKAITAYKGHSKRINSIVFAPGDLSIISASEDGTVRQWDVGHLGKASMMQFRHDTTVLSLAYDQDGSVLASGSSNGILRLWDMARGQQIASSSLNGSAIVKISNTGADSDFIVATENTTFFRWSPITTTYPTELDIRLRYGVSSIATPAGHEGLAAGCWDSLIYVWSSVDGRDKKILRGHRGVVNSLAFSPDGRFLVSGSLDKTVRVWNVQSGGPPIISHSNHHGAVTSVAYRPDGSCVLSGDMSGRIVQWQIGHNEGALNVFIGHVGPVLDVNYSRESRYLVSAGQDSTVRIWGATEDGPGIVLHGHSSSVNAAVWCPGTEDVIASCSQDYTVAVWKRIEGRWLMTWRAGWSDASFVSCTVDAQTSMSDRHRNLIKLLSQAEC